MILVDKRRIQRMTADGLWGTRTLYDAFLSNVARWPEQEAVLDPPNRATFTDGTPRRLTWSQLLRDVEHLSAVLYRHGLRRDDIVVVQLPNLVEQVVTYLACHRLGIVVSPLPPAYREHEIGHVLRLTQASAFVTAVRIGKHRHADMMASMRDAHSQLHTLLVWGSDVLPGAVSLDHEMAQDMALDPVHDYAASVRLSADDVVTICWTSGTEASPKGVPRSSNEWYWQGKGTVSAVGLCAGMRVLNPFPLVNMGGMSFGFVGWLLEGATLVQHQPFDLDVFLQQLRDERIEYTVAAPTILNRLLQNESLLDGIDFNRLKRIGSGAAPLSPWMIETFASRYGVQILNYFGSNEGAAMCGSASDIPDPQERATLFPRPGVPGQPPWANQINNIVQTRLVSADDGREVTQPGQIGEMRIAGPTVFSGYYNAPDINARAFDDQGYFKTGDLFEISGNQQQYLRYVGRSKDLVVRGGMKISAEEIEALVLGHPDVADAAIVGFPDDELGERMCVCIVPGPNRSVELASLVGYLLNEKKVAAFKLPERLLLLDILPRNPVGKLVKNQLRALAKAHFSTQP
jgi:acyl-CoA synthetase (AMP-forming)/AMP-acid ligase II